MLSFSILNLLHVSDQARFISSLVSSFSFVSSHFFFFFLFHSMSVSLYVFAQNVNSFNDSAQIVNVITFKSCTVSHSDGRNHFYSENKWYWRSNKKKKKTAYTNCFVLVCSVLPLFRYLLSFYIWIFDVSWNVSVSMRNFHQKNTRFVLFFFTSFRLKIN